MLTSDPAQLTVAAPIVRTVLNLTTHQLSEFTAGLDLDVGPRPNYPRYSHEAVHLMVAARALRELRVPLDTSLGAASTYRSAIVGGNGWLVCSATSRGWLGSLVLSVADLTTWIAAVGGRGSVVDLRSISVQADTAWQRMTATPTSED